MEYPVPVQLLSHSGTGLVCSNNWSTLDPLPYLIVCLVRLGAVSFKYVLYRSKTPDVDAIKALSQSQIDALNAQLADSKSENDRLKNMLKEANNKPATAPVSEAMKEFITTPVSVFFNCGKTSVANLKDLVNVRALANYAKANDSKIMVTGYADSATGTKAGNQKLSENRAKQVKDELIKMGVKAENIQTSHNGGVDTASTVDNLSPLQFNRRATVQIVEK